MRRKININQYHQLTAFSFHTIQDACSFFFVGRDGEEINVSSFELNTEIKTELRYYMAVETLSYMMVRTSHNMLPVYQPNHSKCPLTGC